VANTEAVGDPETVEWAVETADGDRRWIASTLTSARLDGEPRVVAASREVTQRRQYEETYREIFDTAAATITVHVPGDPTLRDANQTLCDLLGYTREELVGIDTAAITADVAGYDSDRIDEVHRRAVESDEPFSVEWPLQTAGGEVRWIDATVTTASVEGETRVISTGREITEAKRREREYEQIFDGVNDAITVFDPETFEIVDVNQQYLDMLGYDSLDAVRERGIRGLSATEAGYTAQRGREIISRVAETGEPEAVEWRAERADGERLWLEVTLAPAEIGGEQRVLSMQRDITEQRRRQRQLEVIVEQIDEAIYLADRTEGEAAYLSPAYETITGLSVETLRADPSVFVDHVHPDDRDDYRQFLDRMREEIAAGDPQDRYDTEFRFERPDGDVRWFHAEGYPLAETDEYRYIGVIEDVTERKRRKREYEQIFDSVEDGINLIDPDTMEIVDANEAYLDLLGYDSVAELQQLGVDGLSDTESGFTAEEGREIHQRVSETGTPEVVDWAAETADGERRWLEVKLTPAEIEGREVNIVVHRDVTRRRERERAVRALQRASEEMQTATSPTDVAEVAVDTASELTGLPTAACWLRDDESGELELAAATGPETGPGQTALSELPLDRYDYESFQADSVVEYAADETESFQTAVLFPLGGDGLLLAGAHDDREIDDTVLDVGQALADHVTTATSRVERAQAVRESERRFRLIADRIDEVIYLAEPDFSEVVYVNPAYEDVWGRSVAELYEDATSFVDGIDERDAEEFRREFESVRAEVHSGDPADSYSFEFRVRQPDGELRWIDAAGYTIDLSDDETRYVGVAKDITERKRREQRLEVFNRVLRHNLRNHLDVIKAHAEAVGDEHGERILEAANRLGTTGERARAVDRIMAREFDPESITLGEFVDAALVRAGSGETDGTAPTADETTVTTDVPADAALVTDRAALRAAVDAALENAVEYARSRVSVGVDRAGDDYVIEVSDDGPGIPAAELDALRRGTETDLRHGRGLGLWQIRWGVDKLDGRLSFETDDGTTVRITIPDRAAL
jgi:PAS domain S-box-containing protein